MTGGFSLESSDDLLSQAVTHQVSSAQKGLTAVFGMGTGVAPSLLPLDSTKLCFRLERHAVSQSNLFTRLARANLVLIAVDLPSIDLSLPRQSIGLGTYEPSKLNRKVEFHDLVKTSTD